MITTTVKTAAHPATQVITITAQFIHLMIFCTIVFLHLSKEFVTLL